MGVALLAGCTTVAPGGAPGPPGALYVVDPGAAAVVQVDPRTGRPVGSPLPGGRAPWQAVPGPDGGLLVLSAPVGTQELTRVVHAGPGWAARPLPVEPGVGGVRGAVLAGAGGRHAVLAYRPASPAAGAGGAPGCRLALLDLVAGAVARTHDVCGTGETVRDVALDATPGGPVAYVALWQGAAAARSGAGASDAVGGRGRVVALDAQTGKVLAVHATAGVPDRLLLGPAPGGVARRVYCREAAPPDGAERWRLVALDAATLVPEREYLFPAAPQWPALAPDGEHLYALTDDGGGSGRGVVALDLTTGAVSLLLTLPGEGLGLVATAETLYVLDPGRGRLLAVDRRRGRLLGATAVGRAPIALTLRPAG